MNDANGTEHTHNGRYSYVFITAAEQVAPNKCEREQSPKLGNATETMTTISIKCAAHTT